MSESSNPGCRPAVTFRRMPRTASRSLARPIGLAALVLMSAPLPSQTPDHDALRRLKTVDWPRAYLTQDVSLLDRILADDFRMIRSDGAWSSKREELDWVRQHRPAYDSLVFHITRLDVYPNGSAIVAGTGVIYSTSAGATQVREYRSTNVLQKQADGSWRAVASHTSGNRERAIAPGLVDHHVHVLGPNVMRDWRAAGVTFSRPDSFYTSPASLLSGRGDSVAQVVLVPMAHLYANPEFVGELRLDAAEVRRRVRRENAHVSATAARYPGRAVALCSVPVLADWALDDLRWRDDSLGVAGIKLHLASSQVDLRDTTHLARLASIARFASSRALPILLHVDPQRRGHAAAHIRALADRVLAPFPALAVVIAHLGGSGGYGEWTRTVFRTLREWRREVEASGPRREVYFELSAVVLEVESEGVPPLTAAEAALLRDDLRAERFDRFVLGSDYPVFDPVRGRQALIDRVGLAPDEVERIARGAEGGIFRARRGAPSGASR